MGEATLFKVCSKCGTEKSIDSFGVAHGRRNAQCKTCVCERTKKYAAENKDKVLQNKRDYYKKNKERMLAYSKEKRIKNPELAKEKSKKQYWKNREENIKKAREYHNSHKAEISAKNKKFREENKELVKARKHADYIKHKESIAIKQKAYREANKEKLAKYFSEYGKKKRAEKREYLRKYNKDRCERDVEYKLLKRLRFRIWLAVSTNGKSKKTIDLVGCSIPELKSHLESKFVDGMSWDNYGEWHIDHIRPCASFDMSDHEQQKLCFNYKNLQPMWGLENISKGGKWDHSKNDEWLKMMGLAC